jgi:hypothetical protein
MEILKYINDNFDSWYENRSVACIKAVEFAKIERDPKAVYSKVHAMIKIMEDYNKTKKKPNDPMWEDKKFLLLLKKICEKSKERKEEDDEIKEDETSEETITTSNTDQERPKLWTDRERMDTDDDVIDIEKTDKFKLFDAKLKEYNELPAQINKLRSDLKEMEIKLREKEERFKTLKVIFDD